MDRLESKLKRLREQKEKIIANRNEILHIKKKLSDLKLNHNVATYAYSMDKITWKEEVDKYLKITEDLKKDEEIQEYIKLDNQLKSLEQEKINYYKDIQITLKDEINKRNKPTPFVYFNEDKKNIITRDITSSQLSILELNNEVVLPPKELKSKRKRRHFYNRVSFKYLEELTNDNDFSIENKNLGNIKKLIKKN